MEEERLKKFNEENRELERNLKKSMLKQQREEANAKREVKASTKRRSGIGAASDRASGRGSEERSVSVQAPMERRGTKRGRELYENEKVCSFKYPWPQSRAAHPNCRLQEVEFQARPSVKIPLPDSIKSLLVDDWENVTKNQTVVPIPHQRRSIQEILSDYQKSDKSPIGSADYEILEEVVMGIQEYFDKSIGRILLYRFERAQWAEISDRMNGKRPSGLPKDAKDISGKPPSRLYGIEHLCRLLSAMPELIAQTNMDAPSVSRLRDELQKLSSWLGRHIAAYAGDYETVSADYVSKNKGLF